MNTFLPDLRTARDRLRYWQYHAVKAARDLECAEFEQERSALAPDIWERLIGELRGDIREARAWCYRAEIEIEELERRGK